MVRPAWEGGGGPPLFIAIPTKGPVDPEWALNFAFLVQRCPRPTAISMVSAPAVDYARNELVENFLRTPCEWMLWLDTDVMPPVDAFEKLSKTNFLIVSALYRARNVWFASQSEWPVVAGRFTRQVIDGKENLVVVCKMSGVDYEVYYFGRGDICRETKEMFNGFIKMLIL